MTSVVGGLNSMIEKMVELRFEEDFYGETLKAIDDAREKLLSVAQERYSMSKEEIEQLVERAGKDVREEVLVELSRKNSLTIKKRENYGDYRKTY